MMQETVYQRYSMDIRCQERVPRGLTLIESAKELPMAAMLRIRDLSVKGHYETYRRDPHLIYAKGTLLGQDRKTGLVRLLQGKRDEFAKLAGFTESHHENPDVVQVWIRGAVLLNIEGVREMDRGKKVYAVDFNSFTLNENAGGFFVGFIKYSQRCGRACVVFSFNERPIESHELSLSGYRDVKI